MFLFLTCYRFSLSTGMHCTTWRFITHDNKHKYCCGRMIYSLLSLFYRYAVSVRWEREQAERRRPADSSSSGPVRNNRQPCLTFTIEDFNRYFCCCARRVGSMFFLLERKDGSPIVVAGPCWPFCTFVTTPLIVVLSGLVGFFIVSNPDTGLVSVHFLYRCDVDISTQLHQKINYSDTHDIYDCIVCFSFGGSPSHGGLD